MASILESLEACLARGSPYVLIFDLSHSGLPNPVQRATLAAHIRKNKPRSAAWVRGIAVIAPSPLVRGVLTAIFWLEPLPSISRCGVRRRAIPSRSTAPSAP